MSLLRDRPERSDRGRSYAGNKENAEKGPRMRRDKSVYAASSSAEVMRQAIAAELRAGYRACEPVPADIDMLLRRFISLHADAAESDYEPDKRR